MAASKGVAREAQAEQVVLERRMEIAASELGVQDGYTPDLKVAEVVKRLPGYLQPVVTLMATMVPPTEKSKLCKKRGQEALAQAINMVLMVSILVHLNSYQVTVYHLPHCLFLFSFSECYSDGLGA